MKRTTTRANPILRAAAAGLAAASAVCAGIYFGSGRMAHFDRALYWYALASVLTAYAVAYRFTLWASRPASRLYFKRGLQLLLRRRFPYAKRAEPSAPAPLAPEITLAQAAAVNFAGQAFIRRRSHYRWIMHLCLSGGCTLAFAVTFPLVFGWIHFGTPIDNAEIYQVKLFGYVVDTFSIHSLKAQIAFNVLNIAGVAVMIGLVMAGYRRLTDAGERATQTFYEDILPLLIIAFVAITGLALTVSYKFLGGIGHRSMVWIHLVSVVALLFYIPFGKLFHMFQRSCSLCVSLYKKAGASEEQARCLITGQEFASKRHVEDLKQVLDELGFDYRFIGPDGETIHYQDISPQGRRRLIALNQGQSLGR